MKKTKSVLSPLILLLAIAFVILPALGYAGADAAMGIMAPPEPPGTNPHPPVTEEDKQRVAFAELTLNAVLIDAAKVNKAATSVAKESTPPVYPPLQIKLDVTEACLKSPSCLAKNPELHGFLLALDARNGLVLEIRHAHIIPWSFQNFKSGRSEKLVKPQSSESHDVAAVPDMPRPQLANDEYMIHAYVNFSESRWSHVDVILSEDVYGKITLRGFFIVDMPMPQQDFPEGVVC